MRALLSLCISFVVLNLVSLIQLQDVRYCAPLFLGVGAAIFSALSVAHDVIVARRHNERNH